MDLYKIHKVQIEMHIMYIMLKGCWVVTLSPVEILEL